MEGRKGVLIYDLPSKLDDFPAGETVKAAGGSTKDSSVPLWTPAWSAAKRALNWEAGADSGDMKNVVS